MSGFYFLSETSNFGYCLLGKLQSQKEQKGIQGFAQSNFIEGGERERKKIQREKRTREGISSIRTFGRDIVFFIQLSAPIVLAMLPQREGQKVKELYNAINTLPWRLDYPNPIRSLSHYSCYKLMGFGIRILW